MTITFGSPAFCGVGMSITLGKAPADTVDWINTFD